MDTIMVYGVCVGLLECQMMVLLSQGMHFVQEKKRFSFHLSLLRILNQDCEVSSEIAWYVQAAVQQSRFLEESTAAFQPSPQPGLLLLT